MEKNEDIKSNLRKDFWEKVSDCVEHIETLRHIINNAWLKQKGCVIILLGLKSAFGEVNHNLLIEALKFHRIPTAPSPLYRHYIPTMTFSSHGLIHSWVHRGVLQRIGLSPLFFSLVINTLINTIKSEMGSGILLPKLSQA